jgi:hypothetical protein
VPRNGVRHAARLALCLAPAFVACSDDIFGPPTFCNPANAISQITVSPSDAVVFVDDTLQLAVTAFDRLGHPMDEFPVRFVSSDSTVAGFIGLGTVLSVAPGVVEITVHACDEKATATITVLPPFSLPLSASKD